MNDQQIDHLFRHQFGKMVSILTRIFGLAHLELIEDAVQDTFIKAIKTWREKMPDNPEAWLTAAAKNRVLDIFRKLKADEKRNASLQHGSATLNISAFFLESEIADSQLRMIFTACQPSLDPKEQIAFALRTISGFSSKEISSALLDKEETIKKRLQRARKNIVSSGVTFEIPQGKDLALRLNRVVEVLYLIFNEGFHSNKKESLVRKELCGEALRLTKMILQKESLRDPQVYALFALMCFHTARLDSKLNDKNEIVDLKNQDRSLWFFPLMSLGNEAMNQAVANDATLTSYHYEAAIAAEHVRAPSFESTKWDIILEYYNQLYSLQPSTHTLLSIAIVHLQLNQLDEAMDILSDIDIKGLGNRAYLLYGTLAEYHFRKGEVEKTLSNMDKAIALVNNEQEKKYLIKKKAQYTK